MPPANRDHEYLAELQNYYATHHVIPSYAAIGQLLGMASKSAVSAMVKRLQLLGYLAQTPDKRLIPTKDFFARPLAEDSVRAGLPAAANDGVRDAISIDDYLIDNPAQTVLIRVKGDSMIDAHIQEDDIAVVEKRHAARIGDIVIAVVDGDFTLKYLQKDQNGFILMPANSNYAPIRPREDLEIFGVMVGLIRKV